MESKLRDTLITCISLIAAVCVWNMCCAVWNQLGRPLSGDDMTLGIELIGIILVIILAATTSFKLRDMGLSFNHIGAVLLRAVVISVVGFAIIYAAKLLLERYVPSYFKAGASFCDWSKFKLSYPFTAFIQEFLCRGVVQESFDRMLPAKRRAARSIAITSLYFAAMHAFLGVTYMVGAAILSAVLGIIYEKDRNIWGLTLIHFVLGNAAMVLQLVV